MVVVVVVAEARLPCWSTTGRRLAPMPPQHGRLPNEKALTLKLLSCHGDLPMKRLLLAIALTALSGAALAADAPVLPITKAPAGAEVYIIAPQDGATVPQSFTVRFGLKGMGVAPAGVAKEATGHHHLLIDVTTMPVAGQPIPKDAQHMHFGGGQTETTLKLTPGTHTLQLELGDANHIPFDPPLVSKKITVHVK
jgi:hypothetical protein